MKGRELASVAGTLFDRRALMRGDVTSRTATVSNDDVLLKLQGKMEEFASELREANNYEKIEHETIDQG